MRRGPSGVEERFSWAEHAPLTHPSRCFKAAFASSSQSKLKLIWGRILPSYSFLQK